ncbi:hypothetical protein DFH27DRAFT_619776 [Peziza echinospora]|nr:hypothetical protein DFH27DRAFT_619776 [Peziza echinospora]
MMIPTRTRIRIPGLSPLARTFGLNCTSTSTTTTTHLRYRCLHSPSPSPTTTSTSTSTSTTTIPIKGKSLLTPAHRRILSVRGPDSTKYLQGLTTINVPGVSSVANSSSNYAAFLNAQGRLLFDVFVYDGSGWRGSGSRISGKESKGEGEGAGEGEKVAEEEKEYLLDCAASSLKDLIGHVRRYKLRSKVTIEEVVGAGVWAVWDGSGSGAAIPEGLEGLEGGGGAEGNGRRVIVAADTRAPGWGVWRVVVLPLPPTATKTTITATTTSPSTEVENLEMLEQLDSYPTHPATTYTHLRHLHGIPEGPEELGPPGTMLPMEANIDIMGGIDFRKGCYVGQELTIRTKHRGVVRKRVVPVLLVEGGEGGLTGDAEIKAEQEITSGRRKGQSGVGRVLGGGSASAALGLGLVRLERMFPRLAPVPTTSGEGEGAAENGDSEGGELGSKERERERDMEVPGTGGRVFAAMESVGGFYVEVGEGEGGEGVDGEGEGGVKAEGEKSVMRVPVKAYVPSWWRERGVEGV